MAVGYAYLWTIGHKHMAILLTSIGNIKLDTVMTINTTVNRNRISKDIKDKLQHWFPYNRIKNTLTNINVVEESINELANSMYMLRWTPVAPNKYTSVVLGTGNISGKILPPDLKSKLAEMIIGLEVESAKKLSINDIKGDET